MRKFFPMLMVFSLLVFSCQRDKLVGTNTENARLEQTKASVATDWYHLQLRILLERNSALNGVYFGYIGIGLYESVRYALKNSVSLSTKLDQMPQMPAKENNNGYNWEVSANAALAEMVRLFYTGLTAANMTSIDSLETAYNNRLKPGPGSVVFERSQAFGRSIATAVHNWYLTDNLNATNSGYTLPPPVPGAWVPTPPAFVPLPVNPFIGTAHTYLSTNSAALAPPFPAPYSEDPGSDFYKIVKQVYDVSKTLTTEQKNIALFYIDQGNGVGYTPPGHDFSALTQAMETNQVSLAAAAEAYAKAGIAERDATIVCFRSKYRYNLLRPVTYIRKLIDPSWLPFIATPPHPEYPAAHAFITGAVMQAASRVLGDNLAFSDHSYDFRGFSSRSFPSLFALAEEAGLSRLYGGIHYLPSINIGLSLGKEMGNTIGDLRLHD